MLQKSAFVVWKLKNGIRSLEAEKEATQKVGYDASKGEYSQKVLDSQVCDTRHAKR